MGFIAYASEEIMVKTKTNITEGPMFFAMLKFALPLILTGVLQQLYNMADSIIVGKFSGDYNALGAVGSAAALVNIILNVMISLSTGAGVVIAQFCGAKNHKDISDSVHTAMGISVLGGLIMMAIGFAVTRPALVLMGTQDIYFEKSVLYMMIICIGIPASSIYNFGASVLRAAGDSKTSLYVLSASGVVNVVLNYVFVVFCNMSVEGVAIATVVSQYISAIAVLAVLIRRRSESYCVNIRKIRIHSRILKRIFRIGLPMTFQSALFSFSNVIIASSVNTFPPTVVEAKTIAFSIEAITGTVMTAIANMTITFVGQNYGASKYSRINRAYRYGVIQAVVIGIAVSFTEMFLGPTLSMLYIDAANPNKEAIVEAVMDIFYIMLSTYFMCGVMEVMSGVLKALGCAVKSMIASLIGLAVRVLWVVLVVPIPSFHTIPGLFVAYILAWVVTIIILGFMSVNTWRRLGISKYAKLEKTGENI